MSALQAEGGGLEWHAGAGYRWREVSPSGRVGFTLMLPARTGVDFTNHLVDESAAKNQVLLSGSGVACGDVDGDSWSDVYFCRLEGANTLYRNLGGWRFEDITSSAGVACDGQNSSGAAFADVDGDGDLDLLVNGIGAGTRLFLNDGHGHFTEAKDSGLVRRYGSTGLALGDLDGDGTLDLYVANYRSTTVRSTGFDLLVGGGRRMIRAEDRDRLYMTAQGVVREFGEPDFCYLNDGHGHFTAMSWTNGSFLDELGRPLPRPPRDWSYSVAIRDLNGDRAPDIYVTGDFWSPDRCWINDGQGHFRPLPRLAQPCTSGFSMGVDFADLNRDGWDDFLVLDMLSPNHARRLVQTVLFGIKPQPVGLSFERPDTGRNTLFLNRGDGTYAEIAYLAGLHASEWSWCPVFLDVDLDGFEDVLIPTGHGFDTQDADAEQRIRAKGPWARERVPYKLFEYPRLHLPNLAFRNQGDLTFTDMSAAWGFNLDGISQGIALADLDNDGDLDVVINNMNQAAALYRNDSPAPRVAVRLRGQPPNTRGIGARLEVRGGPMTQSQQMVCGGRYMSADDGMRMFAAGGLGNPLTIEVTWRDGSRSVVEQARANRVYEIEQRGAKTRATEEGLAAVSEAARSHAGTNRFFVDVSRELRHRHKETEFNDFARQPLLPRGLSRLGPGIAWFDVDGDGWDDLIIGGSRGGAVDIFHNETNGFSAWADKPFGQPLGEDLTTVIGCQGESVVILAGVSSYKDAGGEHPLVRAYDSKRRVVVDCMAGERLAGTARPTASAGPLAMADYDGDGELDLLVGGRVAPGRYPEAAASFLLRRRGGRFEVDAENSQVLAGVGMVSGALWSDLNGDGWPELVLACEWGPIRIFRNEHGRLSAWDAPITINHQPSTINQLTGWWNGIAAGDFDGDGQMDLVAGNWGRNTRYEASLAYGLQTLPDGRGSVGQPVRLYYGDFSGSGGVDLLEAYYDPEMGAVAPWRSFGSVAQSMPFVREQFATHRAYAQASASQVLGERIKQARELQAQWFQTTLFLNRGGQFVAQALPLEAQFAPAFGVCAGDFDGDGAEDIFLSQNFFQVHPEDSPFVSGRGLWLKGDGRGGCAAVPGQVSGVKIYGEQRGAALADFDGDGRVDLAVGQNGGPTVLLRNVGGRPGLRVRLAGPKGNPMGIGAVMRLEYAEHQGPGREVHAGAGYWSQDSAVQVLGISGIPTHVWVRWPGGRVTRAPVPGGTREVVVKWDE